MDKPNQVRQKANNEVVINPPFSDEPTFTAKMKIAIQEAKISALKQVVGEFEAAMKDFGYGRNTVVEVTENLEGKEPSASINAVYFGSWGQYEGEDGMQLDMEAATFLTDTVSRITKAYPKFGIGWLAGDDCDIYINIRNCRGSSDTKQQAGFVMPDKPPVEDNEKIVVKRNKTKVADIKKAKLWLVKKVGRLVLADIKEVTKPYNTIRTIVSPSLVHPRVIIKVRYFGHWQYCEKRKRMHISEQDQDILNGIFKKITDRYPKFVIEYDTNDRAWVDIAIRNKQPSTLAMLRGALTPAQQRAAEQDS